MAIIYSSSSPYNYVENNPINFTDPNGMHKWPTGNGKGDINDYPLVKQFLKEQLANYISDNEILWKSMVIASEYPNVIITSEYTGNAFHPLEAPLYVEDHGYHKWTKEMVINQFIFDQGLRIELVEPIFTPFSNIPAEGEYKPDLLCIRNKCKVFPDAYIKIPENTLQIMENVLRNENNQYTPLLQEAYIARFVMLLMHETCHHMDPANLQGETVPQIMESRVIEGHDPYESNQADYNKGPTPFTDKSVLDFYQKMLDNGFGSQPSNEKHDAKLQR